MSTIMSYITFVLAVIGSVGTITSWVIAYVRSRQNLAIKITWYSNYKFCTSYYISMINNSSMPVSITAISLKYKGEYLDALSNPQKIIYSPYESIYSTALPINVPSHATASAYILIPIPQDTAYTSTMYPTLRICTNRKNPFEMSQSLEGIPHNIPIQPL